MAYDIIFVSGEMYFDHPLSGTAILRKLLEKQGYKVGVIEKPTKESEILKLGKPNLFFGVSSGSIDSMVRNYTPMKRLRKDDKNLDYNEEVPDRAVIVYSNWVKKNYKDSVVVIGGTEASLRRFTHYDYWQNRLRKPILFDAKVDILVYGNAEKQMLEIAEKVKNNEPLTDIKGTCIVSKDRPKKFIELPSHDEVLKSKNKFCDLQNKLTTTKNIAQKIDNRYLLQYHYPEYTSKDLDEYYELPFTRKIKSNHLKGFEFSIVTHRGCIGECNFCALKLLQGARIISRSEESILREVQKITKMKHFHGNIDDLGGPSANMYGMDCNMCNKSCIDCQNLDKSNIRLIKLLKKVQRVKGVRKVFVRSGIRYDLASEEYLKLMLKNHASGQLKVAPEHVNKDVLKLMNKDKGNFNQFVRKVGRENIVSYFMVGHPGCGMKETKELAEFMSKLNNVKQVQVFTPTPMTVSTCMYYTGINPETKTKIHVPYKYSEKKRQKNIVMGKVKIN